MQQQTQNQTDWYGKAVFIGAMSPYVWRVSVGASIACFGMNTDIVFLHDGLILGGVVLAVSSFILALFEFWHQYDNNALRLDVIRKQNGLAPTGHIVKDLEQKQDNASSTPAQPEPHTVWLGQATDGGSTLKRYDIKPEEKPTQQFIEWVKRFTENNPRRRVPEREAMAMEEYAGKANVWLTCMDRVGVLEREDERPNAARRWKDGVSLANALAIFGYASESFLPSDGITVPPAPTGANGKNA